MASQPLAVSRPRRAQAGDPARKRRRIRGHRRPGPAVLALTTWKQTRRVRARTYDGYRQACVPRASPRVLSGRPRATRRLWQLRRPAGQPSSLASAMAGISHLSCFLCWRGLRPISCFPTHDKVLPKSRRRAPPLLNLKNILLCLIQLHDHQSFTQSTVFSSTHMALSLATIIASRRCSALRGRARVPYRA